MFWRIRRWPPRVMGWRSRGGRSISLRGDVTRFVSRPERKECSLRWAQANLSTQIFERIMFCIFWLGMEPWFFTWRHWVSERGQAQCGGYPTYIPGSLFCGVDSQHSFVLGFNAFASCKIDHEWVLDSSTKITRWIRDRKGLWASAAVYRV